MVSIATKSRRKGVGRPKMLPGNRKTREAILLAARSVFSRRGFEGTSMREVAHAARVNNAMIYYYFRDKGDLYRSVLAHSFSEFDRLWCEPIFSSRASSRAKIRTYVEGFIAFQHANEELRRIMTMEFASCSSDYRWLADNYLSRSYQKLVQLLTEGMRSGELKKIDPSLAIPSLVGMIIHSFNMRPIAERITGKKLDLDRKRFGKFVADMFFDGLCQKGRIGTAVR